MKEIILAKSYTSVYEIFSFETFSDVLYHKPMNAKNDCIFCVATCGEMRDNDDIKMRNCSNFVTSEGYHGLNKIRSKKSIVRSTSTIFYDLDDVAKRHSFHCLKGNGLSTNNLRHLAKPTNKSIFGGKSETIVQDCAMQVHPNFHVCNHKNIKIKNFHPQHHQEQDTVLSSEIFLRDDECFNRYKTQCYYEDNGSKRHQKFWSYAKYRSEKSDMQSEEKKSKKKDRGKRTEDPCPCQLFSYACPCTNQKSLTELARNSKSLTVADNITSTTNIYRSEHRGNNNPKKNKHKNIEEDKLNGMGNVSNAIGSIEENEVIINDRNISQVNESKPTDKSYNKSKSSNKRSRKLICPKCKERVEVLSVTDDEIVERSNSMVYQSKEISSTTAYTCKASPNGQGSRIGNDDICKHEPRCELVPVCQILPCDEYECDQHKHNKQSVIPKSTPRVLRVTKACRHHPPCTVVPSCQRANVLKNNCEFIPPCLHRPRCINLPLCVPVTKSPHYEEYFTKPSEDDNNNCPHYSRCSYIPVCHHDSKNLDKQIHMVSRMQNQCEFMTGIQQAPTYLIEPHTKYITSNLHSCKKSPMPCSCRSNKSCQYDCIECRCPLSSPKKNMSEETVVFIRDVGCQFRNKTYSPIESVIRTKSSSASFDYVDMKMGDYCTNIHTLRYEDKFTTPISRIELSISSASSSVEVDRINKTEKTGFNPNATYITAYNTQMEPANLYPSRNPDHQYSAQAKTRKSFPKNKSKRIFVLKTRRKSRTSKHAFYCQSKRAIFPPQIMI